MSAKRDWVKRQGTLAKGLTSFFYWEQYKLYITTKYEKTLVAWFKSNLLLNVQMYNMSSLHKYY